MSTSPNIFWANLMKLESTESGNSKSTFPSKHEQSNSTDLSGATIHFTISS